MTSQVIDQSRPRRHEAEQFELFPVKLASAPSAPSAPKTRRLCPITVSGAPMGGRGDLGTLVIDGTRNADKEAVIIK